jgi:hypothetical protein
VAVIHSLTEYDLPNDKLLFFAKGDSLDPNGIDVIEATAIEGTAFVLPCVENMGDDFPTSQETASYFLVFPLRSEWIHNWCWGEGDDDATQFYKRAHFLPLYSTQMEPSFSRDKIDHTSDWVVYNTADVCSPSMSFARFPLLLTVGMVHMIHQYKASVAFFGS